MNNFEQNITSLYQGPGKKWLDALPNIILKISELWNLIDLKPIKNLTYHYVLEGSQNNKSIILKLYYEHKELEKESRALRAFANYGAAKILHQNEQALLLKKATPGHSLKNYFPPRDNEATKIICEVINKLHQTPIPSNHRFPHIRDWLSALDKNWSIPKKYLEKARELKNHLLATMSPNILLHGDLHHDNILAHNNDWIIIDPKGVVGETEYELGSFIRNPIPDLLNTQNAKNIIINRIQLSSELLGLDKKRILQWCFVQTVLGHIWCIQDNIDPEYFIKLTESLWKQ